MNKRSAERSFLKAGKASATSLFSKFMDVGDYLGNLGPWDNDPGFDK